MAGYTFTTTAREEQALQLIADLQSTTKEAIVAAIMNNTLRPQLLSYIRDYTRNHDGLGLTPAQLADLYFALVTAKDNFLATLV